MGVRRRPFGSVRARTAAASVAVVGAGILLAGFAGAFVLRRSLTADVDRAALRRADDVAALATSGTLPARLPSLADDPDDLLVQVVSASGALIAATDGYGDQRLLPAPALYGRGGVTRTGLPGDPTERFRVVAVAAPAPAGPVTVYALGDLTLLNQTVGDFWRLLGAGALVFLGFVGAGAWLLAGRALRPVEEVRAGAAAISADAPGARIPVPPGDDEITRLTRTMNGMLERLESASDRQRRFVADASHEMKSPLAAVEADLEVALTHPDGVDWSATAARILAEDRRLEQLVGDLSMLARYAAPEALAAGVEPVDIDALVADEVARPGPRSRVAISVVGRAGSVPGRPGDLARAVRNVLDNALRHARSSVVVELSRHGGAAGPDGVLIVVADDGPGIAAPDRARAFERFTRLDDARTRDGGGSGLGLPIAREIIESHGGTIVAADGPGGRFLIDLPVPDSGAQSRPGT